MALRSIAAHIEQHGVAPSVVELSKAMCLNHKMASHSYLNSLELKGYVRREIGVPRSIVVLRHEDGQPIDGEGEAA